MGPTRKHRAPSPICFPRAWAKRGEYKPRGESRDRAIANILRAVLERSRDTSSDHPPRSLTIRTASYCHYLGNGARHGYHGTGVCFDILGSETIKALHDSRFREYFTTLRLERVWNVPTNLMSNFTVQNLHVKHAHFIASEILGREPLLPSLVNLEIQESPSFVPVCYYGLQAEHTSPIAKVTHWLRDQGEYEGLTRIGRNATVLEIVVHECKLSSVFKQKG